MAKEPSEEGQQSTATEEKEVVGIKGISSVRAIGQTIVRFADTVINLLLFASAVNPEVPSFLYWLAGAVGLGYTLLSGPLGQEGEAHFSWDADRKKMRTMSWRKSEYTAVGYLFLCGHSILRIAGAIWLFAHCISAAMG